MSILKDKKILLGVAGSIAAYKAVQVAHDLTKAGAQVDVLLTPAAARFVTPLTFQALTHRDVHTDIFENWTDQYQGHVTLARQADLVVLVPATADLLAKLAHGLADDVISLTLLSATAPLLIAPAMESHMYAHPATRQNLEILQARGASLIEAEYGALASGAVGMGRMAEPATILAAIQLLLAQQSGTMRGQRVVVTAGGTQEPLDPVRFIGNRSSGQMGYALAAAALQRGAAVTLISGPVRLEPPFGCDFVPVQTALEMQTAVHTTLDTKTDILIMAAAVADYRPATTSDHKIKKTDSALDIRLEINPDILAGLATKQGLDNLLRVGFAAETDDLLKNAQKKLLYKNLDLIVANEAISSIGAPDNQVILIERNGQQTPLARLPKNQVAEAILDKIMEIKK
jgi:phosphopantothenoylcysteine decarboxylase/phosphopantothenate--cysteine ligase